MAVLLFRLTNVPDEEAHEIRELLQTNNIYFYETDAGFWRIGVDALWLPDNSQEDEARRLINAYQAERLAQQKQNYAELAAEGIQLSFWDNLKLNPTRVIFALLGVVFVLALTFAPFALLVKIFK